MGEVDFGRTARDYARHRQGFPASYFERLSSHGLGLPGQRILDLGTGTGQLGRGFAKLGAHVTGLDRSAELLEMARELDREEGLSTPYVHAPAEEIPFADASFDAVTAAQCFHWFERERVCSEVLRVLVPGGSFAIAQLDWLPRPGTVAAFSEALVLKHNPDWQLAGLDGIPKHFVHSIEEAGFVGIELFAYDLELSYTHAAWRGRIRACAGVAASPHLDEAGVRTFDDEHARELAERFPEDPLRIPHRAFTILSRRP